MKLRQKSLQNCLIPIIYQSLNIIEGTLRFYFFQTFLRQLSYQAKVNLTVATAYYDQRECLPDWL